MLNAYSKITYVKNLKYENKTKNLNMHIFTVLYYFITGFTFLVKKYIINYKNSIKKPKIKCLMIKKINLDDKNVTFYVLFFFK